MIGMPTLSCGALPPPSAVKSCLAYLVPCARTLLAFAACLALGAGRALHGQSAAPPFSFVSAFTEDVGRPTGIALDTIDGVTFLYVSDHEGGRVFRYNLADGSRVQLARRGNAPGEFLWPDAIAVEPATHDLYIADRQLHRITRLTRDGGFVMKWGDTGTETNRFGLPGAGSARGQFNEPIGVALDSAGNIYTTEHENHRVQKFRVMRTASGWSVETLTTWGSIGSGPGQFGTPYGITVDPMNNVWVADGYNSRLQKFTTNGEFLGQFVVRGATEPHLVVTWVAFDRAGAIYVAVTSDPNPNYGGNPANQRVEKFSPSGVSLGRWGSSGGGPGQFQLPFGIAIRDAINRAYVADHHNRRIQIFALDSAAAPPVNRPPPVPPNATLARLVNLSSRQFVGAGDANRAAMVGFVLVGSTERRVLVRAVGPGLAPFGIANPLANPRLQIFDRNGRLVLENDNWSVADVGSAAERSPAFPLVAESLDAAVVGTLPPGAYTAHVTAASGSGVALIEVYDVGEARSSVAERLGNLSARGFVEGGEGELAAGFVVSGNSPTRVLVRAVGPGLGAFGVTDVLSNPTLEVYASGSATPLARNDDWETPQLATPHEFVATAGDISTASRAAGAFVLAGGSRDAALVLTLPAGGYTAVVRGAAGETGVALVEVFELPAP